MPCSRGDPDFELRRYPDHLVAEIVVGSTFELAGNTAFPTLARYIGGPPWTPWFLRRNEVVVPVAPGSDRTPGKRGA